VIVFGVMALRLGGVGLVEVRRSAEPDLDVAARLPCLLRRRREDARIEDVVEILKVECESPPVPTISHYGLIKSHKQMAQHRSLNV
jgi:hypothetical protein